MDERKIVEGFDLAPSFAAGVASVAREHGMNEKDAEAFVCSICKQAALGYGYYDDVNDTFWERNKSRLIPTIVGGLSFWAGAEGNNTSRPTYRADSWALPNAFRSLGGRLNTLFGLNQTPLERVLNPSDLETVPASEKGPSATDALRRLYHRIVG